MTSQNALAHATHNRVIHIEDMIQRRFPRAITLYQDDPEVCITFLSLVQTDVMTKISSCMFTHAPTFRYFGQSSNIYDLTLIRQLSQLFMKLNFVLMVEQFLSELIRVRRGCQ